MPLGGCTGRGARLVRAFERSCEASALLGALALFGGMAVVLADVATRRTLGSPITGVTDLVQLAVVASACLALPLAFARGTHVAVEFLTDRLPEGPRRFLRVAVALAEAGLLLLLLLYGWRQAEARLLLGDVSPTLGLPVLLYWAPYLIGIGLSVPAALLALLPGREPSAVAGGAEGPGA
jgi:TRAP-type C4-dicarboxylate transport system permease small subunit